MQGHPSKEMESPSLPLSSLPRSINFNFLSLPVPPAPPSIRNRVQGFVPYLSLGFNSFALPAPATGSFLPFSQLVNVFREFEWPTCDQQALSRSWSVLSCPLSVYVQISISSVHGPVSSWPLSAGSDFLPLPLASRSQPYAIRMYTRPRFAISQGQ